MGDAPVDGEDGPSPQEPSVGVRDLVGNAWSSLKTVYYANSTSWQVLKAGGLVFFGFFLWAGANLLYSYNPSLELLRYPMAYGFLLILYGPIHHLVVLPLAFRWRRATGVRQRLGKRLPNGMLALFLVAVVVLGTFPAGPMVVDFQSALESGGADVSPDLLCTKSTTENGTAVHCHLSETDGVDSIEVRSGDDRLLVDDDPPYEFTVHEREMETVTGEKRFTVVLQDEDGALVRRYTRRLAMVDEG
ncbi:MULTISPECIES: hypothetical protein [Halolamina]|uniref:Uncharacterized protein n=1 Tax=Halolamina pelagica TaxID=699431 RepID=A0A1I5NN18_9EURY|nr:MULTISPECIES: hypothetical protein [Halolamina]NHX36378.1 hypothetical protein [Halolamina sp. R1-12]SFP22641.1 hypothetical protein SAMN05216277_10292 [Halolamina pelagica]